MKVLITTFLFLVALTAACGSAEMTDTGPEPVGNDGYDSVAYFAAERAAKGSPQFTFVFNGVKWLFSSNANLEKFKESPEKYIPQFGAHCPVSIANGGSAGGKPNVWKVVDEKLYLFYNEDNKRTFEKDHLEVLSKANDKYKEKDN